jgi:hypothetical protein
VVGGSIVEGEREGWLAERRLGAVLEGGDDRLLVLGVGDGDADERVGSRVDDGLGVEGVCGTVDAQDQRRTVADPLGAREEATEGAPAPGRAGPPALGSGPLAVREEDGVDEGLARLDPMLVAQVLAEVGEVAFPPPPGVDDGGDLRVTDQGLGLSGLGRSVACGRGGETEPVLERRCGHADGLGERVVYQPSGLSEADDEAAEAVAVGSPSALAGDGARVRHQVVAGLSQHIDDGVGLGVGPRTSRSATERRGGGLQLAEHVVGLAPLRPRDREHVRHSARPHLVRAQKLEGPEEDGGCKRRLGGGLGLG